VYIGTSFRLYLGSNPGVGVFLLSTGEFSCIVNAPNNCIKKCALTIPQTQIFYSYFLRLLYIRALLWLYLGSNNLIFRWALCSRTHVLDSHSLLWPRGTCSSPSARWRFFLQKHINSTRCKRKSCLS